RGRARQPGAAAGGHHPEQDRHAHLRARRPRPQLWPGDGGDGHRDDGGLHPGGAHRRAAQATAGEGERQPRGCRDAMPRGALCAFLLHAAIIVVIIVGLPSFLRPEEFPQPIAVGVITEAELEGLSKEKKPQPPKKAEKPPKKPPEKPPEVKKIEP